MLKIKNSSVTDKMIQDRTDERKEGAYFSNRFLFLLEIHGGRK